MNIYIDESGIFAPSENGNQWSTVGALVVPDNAVDDMNTALETLKIALGIEIEEEIKKGRPDSSSLPFEVFIKSIDQLGCTFHAVSTTGGLLQGEMLEKHREATKSAIKNYVEIKEKSESLSEDACALIEKLSAQQFSQCILQTFLVCDLLEKVIPHYAKISPESLGEFNWEFDRKDIVETDFERTFEMLYMGRVQSTSARRPLPLIFSPERNYDYFIRSFCLNNDEAGKDDFLDVANMFGADLSVLGSALGTFDISDLLAKNFKLIDSKHSSGIQVSDLLVSGVNRCLKGNYTDNDKMASLFGKLMLNSSKPNVRAINIMGFSDAHAVTGFTGDLINLMDENSKKVFSKKIIENTTHLYEKI